MITSVAYDSSYGTRLGNENWLMSVVGTVGPVSVMIYASPAFASYRSGLKFFDRFFLKFSLK